jgi:hypothetical protein
MRLESAGCPGREKWLCGWEVRRSVCGVQSCIHACVQTQCDCE